MAYRNLILRLFFSLVFIIIYCTVSFYKFSLVFYLILFIYFLIFIETYIYFKKYKVIPIIYIFISLIFFLNIELNNKNFLIFNFFIIIVVLFDTFSYLVGKFFGKIKLINISPNKTVEGFIGGLIISIFISLYISYLFNYQNYFKTLFFIIVIICSAFIGDIIESFYKRKNNLKNSSELIPGHGGIFDRFDSFLFSIIFYSISNYFII